MDKVGGKQIVKSEGDPGHNDPLFVAARDMVDKILGRGRTADNALEAVSKALQFADSIVEHFESESPLAEPLACRAGCYYCCSYEVWLTPPEALLIAHRVDQVHSEAKKEDLMHRVDRTLRRRDGMGREEGPRTRHRMPCIFLERGKCSIYDVRPFICRALHALDSDECQRVVESGNRVAQFVGYSHRYEVYQAVKAGFREVCVQMGCQMDVFPIAEAVKQCLEQAGSSEAWVRGEPVFAA